METSIASMHHFQQPRNNITLSSMTATSTKKHQQLASIRLSSLTATMNHQQQSPATTIFVTTGKNNTMLMKIPKTIVF
jgi:hypothetical protein